jgi:hypothetical protein
LSRPSLKITRHVDAGQSDVFRFEVWSPFIGLYQQVASIDAGLRRLNELTQLIGQMWLQRHPKQDALIDVPDPAEDDGVQWAEFRVNATTFRSYDTRSFDRLGWIRAAGLNQAAKAISGTVGYSLPSAAVTSSLFADQPRQMASSSARDPVRV